MRNGKGNFLCLLTSAIILVLAVPTLAVGQAQAGKTEDLVKKSDLIVIGKVGRKASE